jgi:DNA-binding response OmpR family regulator
MSNKKILIVEDDADVRLGYKVLLTAHQYDTFFACDSVSAVSEARKHQPDLILLDLGLPAGGGFLVMEWLRTNVDLSLIPVIVVSARDPHSNKELALKAGAKAFIQKPWNDDALLALISKLVGQSEGAVNTSPEINTFTINAPMEGKYNR